MIVNVTQEHIDGGEAGNGRRCAVADHEGIDPTTRRVSVWSYRVCIRTPNGGKSKQYSI